MSAPLPFTVQLMHTDIPAGRGIYEAICLQAASLRHPGDVHQSWRLAHDIDSAQNRANLFHQLVPSQDIAANTTCVVKKANAQELSGYLYALLASMNRLYDERSFKTRVITLLEPQLDTATRAFGKGTDSQLDATHSLYLNMGQEGLHPWHTMTLVPKATRTGTSVNLLRSTSGDVSDPNENTDIVGDMNLMENTAQEDAPKVPHLPIEDMDWDRFMFPEHKQPTLDFGSLDNVYDFPPLSPASSGFNAFAAGLATSTPVAQRLFHPSPATPPLSTDANYGSSTAIFMPSIVLPSSPPRAELSIDDLLVDSVEDIENIARAGGTDAAGIKRTETGMGVDATDEVDSVDMANVASGAAHIKVTNTQHSSKSGGEGTGPTGVESGHTAIERANPVVASNARLFNPADDHPIPAPSNAKQRSGANTDTKSKRSAKKEQPELAVVWGPRRMRTRSMKEDSEADEQKLAVEEEEKAGMATTSTKTTTTSAATTTTRAVGASSKHSRSGAPKKQKATAKRAGGVSKGGK